MTELLHDHPTGASNGGSGPFRIFRRAGEITLAGEKIEWAYFSIDRADLATQITVDAIEIEIAFENPRSAPFVGPQRFMRASLRALRRDQAGHQRGADFAAMDVGAI